MDQQEIRFNAWLVSVNTELGRHIARRLSDAEPPGVAGCATPPAEAERKLGESLIDLGHALRDKADGYLSDVDIPVSPGQGE